MITRELIRDRKRTIQSMLIIFFILDYWVPAGAQEVLSIGYPVGIPAGDMKAVVEKTSFVGFRYHYTFGPTGTSDYPYMSLIFGFASVSLF